MDLNTIQLLPWQIAELYQNVLIDMPFQTTPDTYSTNISKNNSCNVLILINNPHDENLTLAEYDFLKSILAACGLTLKDIALINWAHHDQKPFSDILVSFSPGYILLFDISPKEIGLPVHFPPFQVQHFDGRKYLAAPSLTLLEHDKPKKKELWLCLKTLFSL